MLLPAIILTGLALFTPITVLILICGASPEARDSGLPVLVLAGRHDERMPADMLRAYADKLGGNAIYVELQSDHFMLAKAYPQVRDTIDSWLRQRG